MAHVHPDAVGIHIVDETGRDLGGGVAGDHVVVFHVGDLAARGAGQRVGGAVVHADNAAHHSLHYFAVVGIVDLGLANADDLEALGVGDHLDLAQIIDGEDAAFPDLLGVEDGELEHGGDAAQDVQCSVC
jgi:hypothetical protein